MKKIVSLILCVALMCSMIITVNAANELDNAKAYSLGSEKSSSINEKVPTKVYYFDLITSALIDVDFSGEMEYVYLTLYDKDGKQIWRKNPRWNNTTEEISFQESIYLCRGRYYITISKYGNRYGDFSFTINENPVYETFSEKRNGTNNTVKTASQMYKGQQYIGCLALNDDCDIYKFSSSRTGKNTLTLNANAEYIYIKIYDSKGAEMWSRNPRWNNTTEEISFCEDIYLTSGDYYLSISTYGSRYCEYDFEMVSTSSNESFAESHGGINNKLKAANIIAINTEYTGALCLNDDVDFYRININDSEVELNVTANMEYVYLKLYDESGKEIWYDYPRWNNTTEEISFSETLKLEKGLYFFSVSKYGDRFGNYDFHFTNGGKVISAPPVSEIKVILNGEAIKFDQPPVSDSGRTMVPLRAIFEALGAKVEWNQSTQKITSAKGSNKVTLTLGSKTMYKNGSAITLDVPPKVVNSRTLVPVRAVAEAYGCDVKWEQHSQTVIITD